MVLDAGVIREFDSPANLLTNKTSLFHSLARDAGIVKSESGSWSASEYMMLWFRQREQSMDVTCSQADLSF